MSAASKLRFSPSLLGGHIIECFDNTLYGFFAVMLAPLYFPANSEYASYLFTYGAFAAGFLARPLGALFFGWLGDRQGRRLPLLFTMACIGVPTIVMGLTPTYDAIGLWAPLLMVLCRLSQGFFWGGEFTGVNLYLYEHNHGGIGSHIGMLVGAGALSAAFGAMVGAFFTMDIMPTWFWRMPFILGGLSAMGVYCLRRYLNETQAFTEARQNQELVQSPGRVLLQNHKCSLLLSVFISGLTVMPLYAATILGNRLFKQLGYSTSESLLLNSFSLILDGCLLMFVMGRLADHLGFRRQVILSCFTLAVVVFPSYSLIVGDDVSLWSIYGFIITLTTVTTFITASATPYVLGLFPTHCRYTATAISITLGQALLGGTMPLLGVYLTVKLQSPYAPAGWLFLVAITAAVGTWLLPTDRKIHTLRSGRRFAFER